MTNCDACEHLNDTENTILRTEYWVVALSHDQGYLGRSYVTLREHKASLSELSQEEWQDYEAIVRNLERACRQAFHAEPFNWACMMNNAYQTLPATPHVHWHFRPRYEKNVTIKDVTFTDPEFGYHYDRDQRQTVNDETFREILETIRANLS